MNRKKTVATLIGLALLAPAVQAANDDAAFYAKAERFFSWAEKTYGAQLLAPSNPVSDDDSGYYFRCYQSNLCLGARNDGYVYFYDGKAISKLNTLDSYLQGVGKIPVRLIGTLDGKFADDAMAYFDVASSSSSAPLLLGKGAMGTQYQDIVASVVKAGVPVVQINPTATEVDQLRALAGLPASGGLPGGVSNADVYGLDTDAQGNLYEIVLLPHSEDEEAVSVEAGLDPTTLVYSDKLSTSKAADTVPDDNALQGARMRLLADWLGQNGTRDLPNVGRLAAAREVNGFAAEDSNFADLEAVVKSTESRIVWRFRSNVHNLTTNVWSVHNRTLNEDWFLVRQRGLFSAKNEIHADKENDKGRFTSYYETDTYVTGWDNSVSVNLFKTSPATTQKSADVSSSMSWNLSGDLNASAKANEKGGEIGAGGKIAGGLSVNNTYKFSIPDVTLTNQSGTRVNNASWTFDIAKPYYDKNGFGCLSHLGINGLGAMSQVSRGTFDPVMQWVWRVSPDVRAAHPAGLPITINFKTRVGHIYFGPGCVWNLTDWQQTSSGLTGSMTVPWPPL